jgi:hypothetical protein
MMKDGEPRPAVIDVLSLSARDNFARSLGIEIVEASLGRAVMRVRLVSCAVTGSWPPP